MCPNQLDNLFSVTVPDVLAIATEPRRPANNTEISPKGKEQQDRRDFKLKSESMLGIILLLIIMVCLLWCFPKATLYGLFSRYSSATRGAFLQHFLIEVVDASWQISVDPMQIINKKNKEQKKNLTNTCDLLESSSLNAYDDLLVCGLTNPPITQK